MLNKKTKIVCTLGPATDNVKTLEIMARAGMNVARLNFSHGNYEHFAKIIKNIRIVAQKLKVPIAIMQDLQGPKIRIGEVPPEGVKIKEKQIIVLTTSTAKFQTATKTTPPKIPIQYKKLPSDVQKGDRILIDDGQLELEVQKTTKTDITCKVLVAGIIKSHKGMNVPTASISAKPLTKKDKEDLLFGLKHNVDYVALSFVKSAEDIKELRTLIQEKKGKAKIVAKIERHEAIDNLEEIIKTTDAVMVARGDLGVEIPAEKVPLVQKRIIHLANIHGKPVITATQILQSMVESPVPTRAEVSDAANAVFDHTDALMLSNETATGKYPIEATRTLSEVAYEVEQDLEKHQEFLSQRLFPARIPLAYATCHHAAKLAVDIKAKLIVALTSSGFTAQHIAKHRIYTPIVVITEDASIRQQLALTWGLNKIFIQKIDFTEYTKLVKKLLLKEKLAHKGDRVVIVSNASKGEKSIVTIHI